jgi:hypothetical protein
MAKWSVIVNALYFKDLRRRSDHFATKPGGWLDDGKVVVNYSISGVPQPTLQIVDLTLRVRNHHAERDAYLCKSQIKMEESPMPVAKRRPSGKKARDVTLAEKALRGRESECI